VAAFADRTGVSVASVGRARALAWLRSRTPGLPRSGLIALIVLAVGLVASVHVVPRDPLSATAVGTAGWTASLPSVPASDEPSLVADSPKLRIETDGPGAEVSIDGRSYGTTPVTADTLGVGEHQVVIRSAGRTVRQAVTLEAGTNTTLVVPIGAVVPGRTTRSATSTSGWLQVRSPMDVSVLVGDRLLGTGRAGPISLPAGSHTLEFRDEQLGYEDLRTVTVPAGRTTTIDIPAPSGRLNVNALPWAEVWVDGRRVGETPLANLELSAGRHEVILRHPTLGEHRRQVIVAAGGPTRLSLDLRK
jgi:hypothetical protein